MCGINTRFRLLITPGHTPATAICAGPRSRSVVTKRNVTVCFAPRDHQLAGMELARARDPVDGGLLADRLQRPAVATGVDVVRRRLALGEALDHLFAQPRHALAGGAAEPGDVDGAQRFGETLEITRPAQIIDGPAVQAVEQLPVRQIQPRPAGSGCRQPRHQVFRVHTSLAPRC